MSTEVLIASIEAMNELRARQRGFAIQEERCAVEIQDCIIAQGLLEERIQRWERRIEELRAEESVKASDSSWSLKKAMGL